MNSEKVTETIMAMASIMPGGERITPAGAKMLLADIEEFSEDAIMVALKSCRMELRFFPTSNDIISRIVSQDGRPGAEEAWSMIPKDERTSAVWTTEMRIAFGVASSLIECDPIAARMTFKEKYESLVKQARSNKQGAVWSLTIGYDKNTAQGVLIDAVEKDRMPMHTAQALLPHVPLTNQKQELIGDNSEVKKLIAQSLKDFE